ncbi:MAG TPA: hypothetical protein VFX76_03210 [Roseiflexaceae bacterium]|nr:hypothetical protein [Roseiflexaceae bacterium]
MTPPEQHSTNANDDAAPQQIAVSGDMIGGDKIAGDKIGGDKVLGDKVENRQVTLSIGTLTIPLLPAVIVLLATMFGVAVALWLYSVPTRMPDGYFNVAVAEFSQIDDQNRIGSSDDSELLSRRLFTAIQQQFQDQSPSAFPPLVWHDSMSIFQKRTRIGAIAGDSPDACLQRADDLNAAIIVYGTLDTRTRPAQLHLRFCTYSAKLHEREHERDIGAFQELQGVDRLGSPIRIDLPIANQLNAGDRVLHLRTDLLARLVVGLSNELSGGDFQIGVRGALKTFQDALDNLTSNGVVTDESLAANGGDLVYYFIGREYFLLYQDAATPEKDRPAYLQNAQESFARAIALHDQYARAWSALGGVYFLKARQALFDARPAANDLKQSVDAYQAAIQGSQAEQDRPAEAQARLALALVYWLQADSFLREQPSDNAAAQASLDLAEQHIALGEALLRPEQNRFHGFAAMIHGLIAHWRGQISLRTSDPAAARTQFTQADQFYQQCIQAGENDSNDLFLQRQIIDQTCKPRKNSVEMALKQLQ